MSLKDVEFDHTRQVALESGLGGGSVGFDGRGVSATIGHVSIGHLARTRTALIASQGSARSAMPRIGKDGSTLIFDAVGSRPASSASQGAARSAMPRVGKDVEGGGEVEGRGGEAGRDGERIRVLF
jgi:hypothetical protein